MLQIPTSELGRMRAHCERAYPHEACGILAGTSQDTVRSVVKVMECSNERTDALYDRYRIPAKELITAQKEARAAGLEIVGFYHSHPEFPARWSATDLAEAHWLGCSYVIVSVRSGRANEVASFVLTGSGEENKRFEEENVEAR